MASTQIKDFENDDQARVTPNHELLITGNVTVLNPQGGGGWSNFGQGTPAQIAVSNTSTALLAANPARVFGMIANNSSQPIYLQYGIAAVWQTGWRLMPGGVFIINMNELFQGQINAVTQSGTVNIDVIEGVM